MNFIQKAILKTLLRSVGKAYDATGLHKKNATAIPFQLFSDWFQQALKEAPDQVNIMTLSTASKNGLPSSRLVLLKHFDEKGFVFYTNYTSRKAQELTDTPHAALTFWWEKFFRQVRIEGRVEKVLKKESDDYFQSRDRGSQLGAWASSQSQIIAHRGVLDERVAHFETQFQDKPIPRPPHWGGYRVIPESIEFWQGRLNRLHDRFLYTRKKDGTWQLDRLAP